MLNNISLKFLINSAWKQLLKVYFRIKPLFTYFANLIYPVKVDDVFNIPIIINNRNRLSCLKLLINSLERRGYHNIYIIDNNSTYHPLLQYYQNNCSYKVFYLKKNMGHLSLWQSGIIKQFRKGYFVYTDPDIVLDEECPSDFMQFFFNVMKKYPLVEKVGFSLKIDDLPDTFEKKQSVINWEKQFWIKEVGDNPPLYKAAIDTTFALYKPHYLLGGNLRSPMIRVGIPYTIKHLPWYNDSLTLSDEEAYYLAHCETFTHWTTGNLK